MVPLSRWCACGSASGRLLPVPREFCIVSDRGVWCDAGVRSLLPDGVWRQLTSLGRKRTYDTGERLITEGDSDTHVIVLVDGRVKVTCSEEDGTEVLLAIRGAGDVVGERAAIDQDARSATVTALRPCST